MRACECVQVYEDVCQVYDNEGIWKFYHNDEKILKTIVIFLLNDYDIVYFEWTVDF